MRTHVAPGRLPHLIAVAAVLALSVGACSSGAAGSSADPSAQAAPSASAVVSAPAEAPRDAGSLVPPTVPPGADAVPPSVVAAAIADAADRAGVPDSAVTVVSTRATDWPNPALGCPKRGVMYIDVITPGYRVVVEAGGKRYDYRAAASGGDARLCENPPLSGG